MIRQVSFPYLGMNENGETYRAWAHMTFQAEGTVDKRLVKRAIRRWIKENLGRVVHSFELRQIMRRCT